MPESLTNCPRVDRVASARLWRSEIARLQTCHQQPAFVPVELPPSCEVEEIIVRLKSGSTSFCEGNRAPSSSPQTILNQSISRLLQETPGLVSFQVAPAKNAFIQTQLKVARTPLQRCIKNARAVLRDARVPFPVDIVNDAPDRSALMETAPPSSVSVQERPRQSNKAGKNLRVEAPVTLTAEAPNSISPSFSHGAARGKTPLPQSSKKRKLKVISTPVRTIATHISETEPPAKRRKLTPSSVAATEASVSKSASLIAETQSSSMTADEYEPFLEFVRVAKESQGNSSQENAATSVSEEEQLYNFAPMRFEETEINLQIAPSFSQLLFGTAEPTRRPSDSVLNTHAVQLKRYPFMDSIVHGRRQARMVSGVSAPPHIETH